MKKKKEPVGISPTTYHSLLKDISQIYEVALSDGNENWNKAALYSNWKIGERIVKIEQGNKERAAYGDRILKDLSRDLNKKFGKGFSDRNLRYMRKFFQLYDAKDIHPELSWSHYKLLLLVGDAGKRLTLEKKAIHEGLSLANFTKFIDKAIVGQAENSADENAEKPINSRLKRPLMGLYTYRVLQNFSINLAHSIPNLDLGFSVKIEALGATAPPSTKNGGWGDAGQDTIKFKVGAIVRVAKKGKSYMFETGAKLRELYTYKAHLEKIVDGDTLVVNIDLGFKVFIRQRLRLRGLDAPELGTKQGELAKKFVESRLKDVKFLIIKTHGSDKYDRYLVDVFYLRGEADEEKVLTDGIFLNNEMIEEGLAGVVV